MTLGESLRLTAKAAQELIAADFIARLKQVANSAACEGKEEITIDVPDKVYELGNRTKVSEFLRAEQVTSFKWECDWNRDTRYLYVKF